MKLMFHVLFWVLTLVLLTLTFGAYYSSYTESFYFVSMLMPVMVGTCYFFNYYLVPRYLLTQRYWLFGLYFVYLLIVSFYLEQVVLFLSFIFLAAYSYDNMAVVATDVFLLAIVQYFIVFMFSFGLLIKKFLKHQQELQAFHQEEEKRKQATISVRSDRKEKTIAIEEISYIESDLPSDFVRIHRSFLIHRQKITSYDKEQVYVNGQGLNFGRAFKKKAMKKLGG